MKSEAVRVYSLKIIGCFLQFCPARYDFSRTIHGETSWRTVILCIGSPVLWYAVKNYGLMTGFKKKSFSLWLHTIQQKSQWAGSQMAVETDWRLQLLRLVIGSKIARQFFNQRETKPKRIAPSTRDFSRALTQVPSNCWEFWLVDRAVSYCCDWSE